MTNEEKFKTPKESRIAFNKFCGSRTCTDCQIKNMTQKERSELHENFCHKHKIDCSDCPMMFCFHELTCIGTWFALEAEER